MAGDTVAGGAGPVNPLMPMSFILGGDSNLSLEEIKRRRAIALALAARQKGYPKTLGEGMTYLGESLGDRMAEERLAAAEKGYSRARAGDPLFRPPGAAPPAAGGAALPPGVGPDGPVPVAANPARDGLAAALAGPAPQEVAQQNPTDGAETPRGGPLGLSADPAWSARAHAIGGIESDQDYQAVGVPTKYGRALGRYGVIEANVPKWTKEALGQALTPQQFLANQQAQDLVFKHRFGQYVAQFGEEGAARAWYGGPGNVNNLNAMDQHERLTVRDYGQDYLKRLQGRRSDAGDGSQLAALGGPAGTMTDAPPPGAGARPMPGVKPEPDPTITADIQPATMRAQIAQAPSGVVPGGAAGGPATPAPRPGSPLGTVPGAFAAPVPEPKVPTVETKSVDPVAQRPLRKPVPPQMDTTPSEEELRAMAIIRKYPGDEQAHLQAQALAAFGKARRDAAYARQVKEYDADMAIYQQGELAERAYQREAEQKRFEFTEKQKQAAREQQDREQFPLGKEKHVSLAKESYESVKALPAAQAAIANVRQLMNSDAGMFTGAPANMKLSLSKWAAAVGMPYDPKVENTEAFRGMITPILAALRPAIVGSGAQSQPEFKLLQDAAAGNITLERGSIEKIMNAVEKLNAVAAVNHHRTLITNSGGDENMRKALFGNFQLPIEQLVPRQAVKLLRDEIARNPDKAAAEMEDFDRSYYTPGLAARVLGR
jgi:hypothetical protein